MTKQYKYKQQGSGADSWEVSEYEGEDLLNKYMVYEKPADLIETLLEAKNVKKTEIDLKTQSLIYLGFEFAGLRWSMSNSAQTNWTNLPLLPEMVFPINLYSQEDKLYVLALENRMDFYMSAVAEKMKYLQSGSELKAQIEALTDIDTILNFIDTR